ncbi:YIP1 family protein [Solibacillus isronensis]|uniref:YIP1 family protein n=1 Tax=Solibacillus isronensis TaxID=412383 RepID=UPI002041A5CD|nr:YIP1 family protein [Solibacillus isronensis]MCM3720467.1 YIP1 family protein [Solibacillus isronensis]
MSEQLTGTVDDRHAILSIAVKPRDTIRYVLTTKKLSYFIFVGIIGVFASNLISFIGSEFTGQFTLGDIVYSTFLFSLILYFLSTVLSAGVLTLSAKVFGGIGKFKEMFRMISVTMIPYIWILPVLLFWMQFAPQSFFTISYMETSLGDLILQFVCGTLIIISSIWTYVITVIGISEVHRISKWKAFFASFIVIAVLGATYFTF